MFYFVLNLVNSCTLWCYASPENNYLAGVFLVPSGLDVVLGFGWGSLHWFVRFSYSSSVALDTLAHLLLLLLPGLNVTILTDVVDFLPVIPCVVFHGNFSMI